MELRYKVFYKIIPSHLITRDIPNVPNPDTFKRVEVDVLANGFANPVLVIAGLRVKQMELDADYVGVDRLGGTRLAIAHKHDLDIPCVVSDFVDRFTADEEAERLLDEAAIRAKFRDPPSSIEYGRWGLLCDPPCDYKEWW